MLEVDASVTSRTVALGLLPVVAEKRLLASEKAMHPSRVQLETLFGLEGELFNRFMCFSERRRARCKEKMALSYLPTSMQRAALLFNF